MWEGNRGNVQKSVEEEIKKPKNFFFKTLKKKKICLKLKEKKQNKIY